MRLASSTDQEAASPRNLVRSTDFSPRRNSFIHHRLPACLWPRQPSYHESSDCTWHPSRRFVVMLSAKTDPLPPLSQECDPWKHRHRRLFHEKKAPQDKSEPWLRQARPFLCWCDAQPLPPRGTLRAGQRLGMLSMRFSMIPSRTRLGCCTFWPRAGKPCAKPARMAQEAGPNFLGDESSHSSPAACWEGAD